MKIREDNRGIVLVTTLITVILLGALSAFLVGIMISEYKMSTSNRSGVIGFYAAESGVEEAIFKVKNDSTIGNDFKAGTLNLSFSRNPFFMSNTSYSVTVQSTKAGEAEIVSTGKYQTGIFLSQRVIKTKIVAGTNQNPPWEHSLFGAEEVNIFGSQIDIVSGNIFANQEVDIWGFSNVHVANNVYSNDDINIHNNSSLTADGEIRANNYPPEAPPIEMPVVDFDSSSSTSLYNLATQVYTQQQFDNLLQGQSQVTLNGIIYVTGTIDVKQTEVTVNGALIADGNIKVGMTAPPKNKPNPVLTVNHVDGQISGLLAKSKIQFGSHARNITINGLIYSVDQFKADNFNNSLIVTGGIIAREIFFTNVVTNQVIINYEASYIQEVLDLENSQAPIVQVEHWEEIY